MKISEKYLQLNLHTEMPEGEAWWYRNNRNIKLLNT